LPRLLVDAADDADEICEAFAEGLVMHHRFSEALTLLDAWQKDFPQDPRPHAYRAAISVSGANWLDARRHWMLARDCAPEESEYLLGLAEASFELNDLEATIDALEAYERLPPRRQREPRVDLLKAKTLLQRGDAPAARQILTKLEQQPETAVSATLLLCRIGLEAGETTGLKEKLQSIVQSEPWNTDARHLLARTCTVTGDLASAEEQQSALLTLTRNQQDLQNLLEEVRKSPRDASRRYRVAQLAVRCGPPEDAIPLLNPTNSSHLDRRMPHNVTNLSNISDPARPGLRISHAASIHFALLWVSALLAGCPAASTDSTGTPPDRTSGDETAVSHSESSDAIPQRIETAIRFRDATAATGLQFTYENGEETDQYAILESLGGGAGVCDYDLDGRLDVILPGGGTIDPDLTVEGLPLGLFRQSGDLKFDHAASLARVDEPANLYTHGISAADFDADGFTDLLITGYRGVLLFQNLGDGTFVEVASESEITDVLWSATAAWGDLNGDGLHDL
ncbi:FG-GAP repeat protein, partial [Durusdinium trenchii]